MNFVKKWASCIISFVAGVCGLALSACSGMIAKLTANEALSAYLQSNTSTTKAFKVLTDSDLYEEAKLLGIDSEFMTMKIFAIITLVVSVLLIVYALVMLLKNLNVIKCESKLFDIVGIALFALLLVSTIGLLIASNGYAGAMKDVQMKSLAQFGDMVSLKISVGVYQPAMLVISIISAVAYGAVMFLNKKKSA